MIKMWCFTVTPDDFTVYELTPEYVRSYGPYPAGTFKKALDGVLDIVRHAFAGLDVCMLVLLIPRLTQKRGF